MKQSFTFLILLYVSQLFAQDQGYLSGQLQLNGNLFLEDATIGASNTPQYDHQLFGSESWLDLNYQYKGFDLGLRVDIFNNSNLLNPRDSYSEQGLGKWYVRKKVDDLDIQVGYVYDQVGSGLIFRSYEERPLLIDNGLYGALLKYDLSDNWAVKAFGGRQKNLFDTYGSFIKGISVDGYIPLGKEKKVGMVPGLGFVNKTLSDDQMDQLINTVRTYTPDDSLGLYYNSYAVTLYNTLSFGPVVWYLEGALKEKDIYFDPDSERGLYSGETTLGRFRNNSGSVIYSSLGLGTKGIGVTIEYKRTENFAFKADPFVTLNRGIVNYLPSMSRINSYRLKSRYIPATQDLAEEAIQVELRFSLSKEFKMVQYFSNITTLEGDLLYREFDNEFLYKRSSYNQWTIGFQTLQYNQAVYEGKSGVPLVQTFTPYMEWFKRFSRKKSLKIEAQYMVTEQDYGSWLFFLGEYSMAPHWSFSVSDMYNVAPKKTEALHYPRVDISYVKKANRLSLSYIKQVEGVVCAGGICRLEPAFSGFRFTLNSTIR